MRAGDPDTSGATRLVSRGTGADPAASRPEPPTRQELDGMRARDPAALSLLFDRYFDSLYSLVHRLLGTRELAEDVTQDVFYRAYRSIESLDPGRDPGAWLVTIAVNACRDHWRRADTRRGRIRRPVEDVEAVGDAASASPDPAEALRLRRRREQVDSALRALPESLRLPIVLRDFVGFDHSEIAAMLDATPAAVRKRYSRGLAALAEQLREDRP